MRMLILVTVRTGLLFVLLLMLALLADLDEPEVSTGREDEERGLLRPLLLLLFPLPPSLSMSVKEKLRDSQRASSDCILSGSNELSRLSEGFERTVRGLSNEGESSMALCQTKAGAGGKKQTVRCRQGISSNVRAGITPEGDGEGEEAKRKEGRHVEGSWAFCSQIRNGDIGLRQITATPHRSE